MCVRACVGVRVQVCMSERGSVREWCVWKCVWWKRGRVRHVWVGVCIHMCVCECECAWLNERVTVKLNTSEISIWKCASGWLKTSYIEYIWKTNLGTRHVWVWVCVCGCGCSCDSGCWRASVCVCMCLVILYLCKLSHGKWSKTTRGGGKNHFCRGTEFPARNFYFQSFQNGRGGRGCRVTVIVLHCSF